jgi:hypothetical protein
MYYLVHSDTHECVDFQAIIGISDSKRGLMELLFNYYKYHFVLLPNITFETSHFDIQILEITEEDYNFLLNEIYTNDKLDKITETHEKQNFKPECSNSEFLFVILNNDESKYDIFDKNFHGKYKNIVKKSKQLII